jgi:hypothetical protein
LNNVGSNVAGVTVTPGSGGPGTNQVLVQGNLPPATNPVPAVGALSGPGSAIPGQSVTFSVPYSVAGPAPDPPAEVSKSHVKVARDAYRFRSNRKANSPCSLLKATIRQSSSGAGRNSSTPVTTLGKEKVKW